MSIDLNHVELPFSDLKQSAILGHLLDHENPTFFQMAKDVIKPAWFQSTFATKVWEAKLKYFQAYSLVPEPLRGLLEWSGIADESQSVKNKLRITVTEAINNRVFFPLEVLLPDLTEWLHCQIFKEGMYQAENLYNNKKFPEAFAAMEEKLKEIQRLAFTKDKAFDFSNWPTFFQAQQLELVGACTMGCSVLDRLILPMAEGQGSLLRGDSTILLAPTNIGKTTTMITIIAANLRMGKSVLFLSHEGREADIVEKIWCCMLGVNKADLYRMALHPVDDQERAKFSRVAEGFRGLFTYVSLNKPGMTVEEVAGIVYGYQEKRKNATENHVGYDLLVDDYPSKLTSTHLGSGMFQRRDVDAYVYQYFVQLALENNFHFLGAQQTNRTGFKINRRQKGLEERLLSLDDSSEAFGPMMTATNVITVNRDPWMVDHNWVTFVIAKSRSNQTGLAVACRSKFSHATTHREDYGALWYRGNVPLNEQLEVLAAQGYLGGEVTQEVLQAMLQMQTGK